MKGSPRLPEISGVISTDPLIVGKILHNLSSHMNAQCVKMIDRQNETGDHQLPVEKECSVNRALLI